MSKVKITGTYDSQFTQFTLERPSVCFDVKSSEPGLAKYLLPTKSSTVKACAHDLTSHGRALRNNRMVLTSTVLNEVIAANCHLFASIPQIQQEVAHLGFGGFASSNVYGKTRRLNWL